MFSAQNGTRLGGPVGLPAFFGVQGPPVNGLSDPYCEPGQLAAWPLTSLHAPRALQRGLTLGLSAAGDAGAWCAGVYDGADSQRFFVTVQFFTCLTLHPDCSSKPVFNYLLIASSRTSNPLEGFQGPFYVDTSGVTPQTLQVGRHPVLLCCQGACRPSSPSS